MLRNDFCYVLARFPCIHSPGYDFQGLQSRKERKNSVIEMQLTEEEAHGLPDGIVPQGCDLVGYRFGALLTLFL